MLKEQWPHLSARYQGFTIVCIPAELRLMNWRESMIISRLISLPQKICKGRSSKKQFRYSLEDRENHMWRLFALLYSTSTANLKNSALRSMNYCFLPFNRLIENLYTPVSHKTSFTYQQSGRI
jgi:hypothetical protein